MWLLELGDIVLDFTKMFTFFETTILLYSRAISSTFVARAVRSLLLS